MLLGRLWRPRMRQVNGRVLELCAIVAPKKTRVLPLQQDEKMSLSVVVPEGLTVSPLPPDVTLPSEEAEKKGSQYTRDNAHALCTEPQPPLAGVRGAAQGAILVRDESIDHAEVAPEVVLYRHDLPQT